MSLGHSPSIVTSGLVFAYDMANTQKSFKGAPVTNSQWNNGSEISPWSQGEISDVTGTSYQGPVANAKTWRFRKTGSSNQWHGWESTYGGIWTGSAGDIWTTSYWYKTSAPAGQTGFGIGAFFTADWARAYNTTVLSNVSSIIADGQWHYNYTTVQFNEAYTNAIIADGPSWGYSTQAGELFINGLQWNKNNYATQFAAGTRSNTQALIDLTGNNTITASSLTYASDGTFSFNGSSTYMSLPSSSNWNLAGDFAIESWFKPTSFSTYNAILVSAVTGGLWFGRIVNGIGLRSYNVADIVYSSTLPATGQWHHMIATRIGSTISLYIDGVFINSVTNTSTFPNSTLYVGNDGSSSNWNGYISSARIYNGKGLSAAEVRQNFNALRGRFGI